MDKLPRKELEARFDAVTSAVVKIATFISHPQVNTYVGIFTLLVCAGRTDEAKTLTIKGERHVLESEWEQEKGSLKCRIVLRVLPSNKVTPFVVHWQIESPDGNKYYQQGDYCSTLDGGIIAFQKRCTSNERKAVVV